MSDIAKPGTKKEEPRRANHGQIWELIAIFLYFSAVRLFFKWKMPAWSCLRTVRYEKRYAAACFIPKAAKSICDWLDPGLVSEKRKTPHLPFPQRRPVVQTGTQSARVRTRVLRPRRDTSGNGPGGVGVPSGTPRRPQAPAGDGYQTA